jgi:hypothetical protein
MVIRHLITKQYRSILGMRLILIMLTTVACRIVMCTSTAIAVMGISVLY